MATTRAGRVFKGCAIGCGLAVLIGFGSITSGIPDEYEDLPAEAADQ